MRYVGYSEFFHDASLSIIDKNGNIEYASQAERYSKIKNDNMVHPIQAIKINIDDKICFYENPYLREQIHTNRTCTTPGQWKYSDQSISIIGLPFSNSYIDHHMSHAASAFYTRPWDDTNNTVILTVDGAGEEESATIYNSNFEKLHNWIMPNSVGAIYSEVTELLGFKPLEEEYTVMGLSAYGNDIFSKKLFDYVFTSENVRTRKLINFIKSNNITLTKEDMAASVQKFAEMAVLKKAKIARNYGNKLVYAGGVAQNILINNKLKEMFDDVWIFPCPTDAGSSLGTAAYHYCKHTNKNKINWEHPYLGEDMGLINPKEVVDYLLEHKICGIASGRAEFGPRALGNRSLIADVRYDVKDTVNKIKRRQTFRPFAPAILEEFVDEYFDGPYNEYMQYSSIAKHDYKSVTHVDGTARVQVVRKNCESQIRQILEEYYEKTGVPMLLNTSLNIRGKPIVNNKYDCFLFENLNKTKVFYNDTY